MRTKWRHWSKMWIIIDDRTPKKKIWKQKHFFRKKNFCVKNKQIAGIEFVFAKSSAFFFCEVSGSCKFAKDEVGTFWFFSYLLLVSYFWKIKLFKRNIFHAGHASVAIFWISFRAIIIGILDQKSDLNCKKSYWHFGKSPESFCRHFLRLSKFDVFSSIALKQCYFGRFYPKFEQKIKNLAWPASKSCLWHFNFHCLKKIYVANPNWF